MQSGRFKSLTSKIVEDHVGNNDRFNLKSDDITPIRS